MNAPTPIRYLHRTKTEALVEASMLEAEQRAGHMTLLARDAILRLPQYLAEPDGIVLLAALAALVRRDANLRQYAPGLADALDMHQLGLDDVWHDDMAADTEGGAHD